MRYIRGGNAGVFFPSGRYPATMNSCLRIIFAREFIGQPLPNRRARYTFAIGTLAETLVLDDLQAKYNHVLSDVEVSEQLTKNVGITGHIDFICDDETYEHKSISSINSYKNIIQKGIYKVDNVVQLVGYMIIREKTEGTLLYTSMLYPGIKGCTIGDQREFKVKIDENTGLIYVDDFEFRFSCVDVIAHRTKASELIEQRIVYPYRPDTLDPPFSPCSDCYCSEACDIFDINGDKQEFIDNVNKNLDVLGRRV